MFVVIFAVAIIVICCNCWNLDWAKTLNSKNVFSSKIKYANDVIVLVHNLDMGSSFYQRISAVESSYLIDGATYTFQDEELQIRYNDRIVDQLSTKHITYTFQNKKLQVRYYDKILDQLPTNYLSVPRTLHNYYVVNITIRLRTKNYPIPKGIVTANTTIKTC